MSQSQSKIETIKALMRRPETKKLMRKALSSPIGSTSRSQAKKIFSIMNKLHSNAYDGSGGPGMMMERQDQESYPWGEASMSPPVAEQPKNMVIFHKIPKANIKYGNAKPKITRFDGQGGPGDGAIPYSPFSPFSQGGTLGGPMALPDANASPSWPADPAASPAPAPYTPAPGSETSLSRTFFPTHIGSNVSIYGPVPATPSRAPATPNTGISTIGGAPSGAPPGGYHSLMVPPSTMTPPKTVTIGGQTMTLPGSETPIPPPAPEDATSSPEANMSTPAANMSTPSGPRYAPPPAPAPAPQSTAPGKTGQPGTNLAAANVASILDIPIQTSLTDIPIADLAKAIARNEGFTNGKSGPAIANNSPGNLKFVGQAGATRDGAAPDGGYYAKFSTVQAGWNALYNDLSIKYTSGKYATLGDLMAVYSPGGLSSGDTSVVTPGAPSVPTDPTLAAARGAVTDTTGGAMFAYKQIMDPNNPITHGQTMEQTEAQNRKSLWDQYNIGGLRDEENRLREEQIALPKDATAYIQARDQYLAQTDKSIDDYIEQIQSDPFSSMPDKMAESKSHLNYLYTLRGRQNQTYLGYLNDAVTQHQAELDHVGTMYSTALNAYEIDLKSANAITEGQYKMYASALQDMYTTVEGAPLKAQQLLYLQGETYKANAQAIADAAKGNTQNQLIDQGKKLEGYIWDSKQMVKPGVDLVNVINELTGPNGLEPDIQQANIVAAYYMGVINYLNAFVDPTPTAADSVTAAKKEQIAKDAITQFAHLAISGKDNPNTVDMANKYLNEIENHLAASTGGSLIAKGGIPGFMQVIKELNPSGGLFNWFPHPPTEQEFINKVKSQTGGGVDETIAQAFYAVFKRYVRDGGSPASFVQSKLYNTIQTSDRAHPVELTPDEVAQKIGKDYAASLVEQALNIQPEGVGSTLSQ